MYMCIYFFALVNTVISTVLFFFFFGVISKGFACFCVSVKFKPRSQLNEMILRARLTIAMVFSVSHMISKL